MKGKYGLLGIGLICMSLLSTAYATDDLLDVYGDALRNDPTFKSARAARLSAEQALPQAEASGLPSLILTGNSLYNKQYNRGTVASAGTREFISHSYTFNLTQPLFDFAAWAAVSQASESVKQAEATYHASAEDLIIRVAAAYFAILEAEDTLRFTEAEKRANQRQLEQAQQRYKVGLDAITSVYDAQAAYDGTVAEVIAAKNNLANSKEALRAITGKYYSKIIGPKAEIPLPRPNPDDISSWVAMATRQNYTLLASRFASKVAKENIRITFAGNLPVVDAVGSFTRAGSGGTGFGGLNQHSYTAGVQLSFPIFQGGLVLSQSRQAKYDYQQALADMETTYRTTVDTTRQTYNNVISGISKIKADRQAVISAQSSVESSEAAFKVGTRTIVDVLDAQRNLYDAQRILSRDQYAYINDFLALKQAAGTLNIADIEQINSRMHQLQTPPKVKKLNV